MYTTKTCSTNMLIHQKPVQQKLVKKENFNEIIFFLEKINKVSDILFDDVLNVDNLICNDIDVLNKTTFRLWRIKF